MDTVRATTSDSVSNESTDYFPDELFNRFVYKMTENR